MSIIYPDRVNIDSINIEDLSVDTRFALMLYARTSYHVEQISKDSITIELFLDIEGKPVLENGQSLMCEHHKGKEATIHELACLAASMLLEKAPEAVIRELADQAVGNFMDRVQAAMPEDITNEEAGEILKAAEAERKLRKEDLFKVAIRTVAYMGR